MHNYINMKVAVFCFAMLSILYHNWTDMGVDRERQDLNKIRNSQGYLEKAKNED